MKGPESTIECDFDAETLKTEEGFETGNTKHEWDLAKLRSGHRVLAEYVYEKRPVARGYAGRTLYVNLTTNEIKEKPVDDDMKQMFTGGKGFDLKLIRDGIKPETRWNSEENILVMSAGPLCGATQYSGMGKCLAATVSPLTNSSSFEKRNTPPRHVRAASSISSRIVPAGWKSICQSLTLTSMDSR